MPASTASGAGDRGHRTPRACRGRGPALVLRRNDLAAVVPPFAAAVAELGFHGPANRPGPDLLRDVARMGFVERDERPVLQFFE